MGAFLVAAAAFVFYSTIILENYRRMRIESVNEDIKFETESVNKAITEIKRAALFFAATAKVTLEEQSKVFGEKTTYEFMQSAKIAVGGGFFYEPYKFDPQTKLAGCYAFIDPETNEVELEGFDFTKDYDYLTSVWYTEIADILKSPYEVVWTRPYVDDSGTFAYMVTASAGVFDENNKLIALSTVDWKIFRIVEKLNKIKATDGSFIIISVPEKDLIISNTRNKNDEGAALSSLPWDIYADTFELGGVSYMTFRRIMDNGWMLSVQVPAKEIFAEIETRTRNFSIISIIVAVLLLLYLRWAISKLVNEPIEQLTQEVKEVGGGNLDKHIEVKSNDEIGILAAAFNKMTVDLKATIEQFLKEQSERQKVGEELNVAAQSERERCGAELSAATDVLTKMLPNTCPLPASSNDFDIHAVIHPADGVGSSFYDYYFVDSKTLAILIADVSGKGIPFAVFMMIAKTLIKNHAQSGKSPKEVFDAVNNLLCEDNEAAMFVSAFFGYLDIESGKFTFVNAGHSTPILHSNGKYDYLKTQNDFVLGGMKDMTYSQDEIALRTQDEILLYTDGVTKAMNNDEESFGEERLLSTVNNNLNLPLNELSDTIKSEIDKFVASAQQMYDITMLNLRYKKG
ncbi:MAG: SpoIIE family protein phosphatase [Chitinivibrionia bacterium]|nr:SpoIIE family protein phosphatase [Chitinivibrionia bacterium]